MGVGVGVREAQAGVDRDRGRVVGLDVEQDLGDPEAREVVQPGQGEQLAEAAALRGRVDADDVHLAELGGVLLGPVEAEQPARRPSATSRPAGSNHGSAIRSARLAASIAPCSGWWAKAAALTRTTSSGVGGAVAADGEPAGTASSGSGVARSAGASPTARAPARSPWRRASAAAAGWSPCDHALSGPSPASASASSARPTPRPRASGRTTRLSSSPMHQREAVVAAPRTATVVRVVPQRQPGRLVERVLLTGVAEPPRGRRPRPRATSRRAAVDPGHHPRTLGTCPMRCVFSVGAVAAAASLASFSLVGSTNR